MQSKAQLLKLYIKQCADGGKSPLSRPTFNKFFYEMNLSIHQIKKDKCDICTQHEVRNLKDEVWNEHILKKDRARREKVSIKQQPGRANVSF